MIDWEGALCREVGDPDLWFSNEPDDIAKAIDVCSRCPLKEKCLQFAKYNGEQNGIWGGVQAPFTHPRMTVSQESRPDVARSLFRAGIAINEIARRLGVTRKTVREHYLAGMDVGPTTAQRSQETVERTEQAREMKARGMDNKEISTVLGVHISTVRKYLRG